MTRAAFVATVVLLFGGCGGGGSTTFEPLRIAEDDAGWLPQFMGNGQGHVDPFSSPFPSLHQ